MEERIRAINDTLERIGSRFRTEDGRVMAMYTGNLIFLRKTFRSIDDMEAAVEKARVYHEKRGRP